MKDLYKAARALYLEAFEGESPAFADALFAMGFPQHLLAIGDHGKLVSMLFALPYPIVTEKGPCEAYYVYAVATAREYRGRGYAKRLLSEVASRGKPVFLRPMSPSLFRFYESAGFTPFSPHGECEGKARVGEVALPFSHLTPEDYLAARDALLCAPYCRMTHDFLSLAFRGGGAVGLDTRFAALFERHGDTVLFKECLGDRSLLPDAAAFLGASRYHARFPAGDGAPFGVGIDVPEGCTFLAALD